MKELELKEMMARHRQELSEKDITICSVGPVTSNVFNHVIWDVFVCSCSSSKEDHRL